MRDRRQASLRGLLRLAVMALFAWPLLLLVGASLWPPGAAPVPGSLWPEQPGGDSYRALFASLPFGRGLLNGLLVTVPGVALSLCCASLAGLGVRLLGPAGRTLMITLFVAAAAVPATAIWLPRFLLFDALDLVGSWLPLLAPALYGATPLCTLLYIVAISRLPQVTIDAARMEGLGWLAIWWRIVLPQVRPATFAAALLAAAMFWGNYTDALLYLQQESRHTPALMLASVHAMGPTNWSVLMAGSTLVTLPLLAGLLLFLGYRRARL